MRPRVVRAEEAVSKGAFFDLVRAETEAAWRAMEDEADIDIEIMIRGVFCDREEVRRDLVLARFRAILGVIGWAAQFCPGCGETWARAGGAWPQPKLCQHPTLAEKSSSSLADMYRQLYPVQDFSPAAMGIEP